MKKALLLSAALASTCTAFAGVAGMAKADASALTAGPKAPAVIKAQTLTRADGDMESIDFTYAEELYTAYSLNGTSGGVTRIYLGFIMTEDDIKSFAGSKVTGFSVYSPTNNAGTANSITDARFYYSTDPELAKMDYTQDFNMSKSGFAENRIAIDEPYTITGEEDGIFFGYSFVVPKQDDMYYFPVDDIPNDRYNTCIYGSSNTEELPVEFYSGADQVGALCMSVKLESESLPKFVNFTTLPATLALPLGEASTYPITLKATCGAPIESIDLEYTFAGNTFDYALTFDPALSAGAARYINTVVEFPAFNEKLNGDVMLKLTKINGIENAGDNMTAEVRVAVVDQLPVRRTLIEEYTGTWCPWCTRGYAAMEYIKNNFPDFVTAAYHNDDPMEVITQYPAAISGFPSASLNRGLVCDPYYGTQSYNLPVPIIGNIMALDEIPTAWEVKAAHEWESDDVLVAKANVVNVAGFKDKEFKIAYLLVADGLTGKGVDWMQANNYATQKPEFVEELNAFCRGGEYGKSKVVGLPFNDVVISPNGVFGIPGSVPTEVEPYQAIEHSFRFDLTKISSSLEIDKNKLRVIAAVLDPSGAVLNCAKDEVNDFVGNAVEGLIDENLPAEYYNLSGVKVANPTEGIFIRRQGAKAEKVIIR